MEPRILTRWDCHKFARDAYDAGIRYIGGCCGVEPYHIRAVAEEVRMKKSVGGLMRLVEHTECFITQISAVVTHRYHNFRPFTITADYPHRLIIAYSKKSQQIACSGG